MGRLFARSGPHTGPERTCASSRAAGGRAAVVAHTVSTLETFQKIYRPEIYNANSVAAQDYRPSLAFQDFSLTRIVYDREERRRLAVQQGRFAEEYFIKPHASLLAEWSASCAL